MGAQNLRLYERRGLIEPDRTDGGARRYSPDDLDRLRRIGELIGAGLNLAGVALVVELEDGNARLRAVNSPTQELDRSRLHKNSTAMPESMGRPPNGSSPNKTPSTRSSTATPAYRQRPPNGSPNLSKATPGNNSARRRRLDLGPGGHDPRAP
jgi:DNA-binding transcriptional MerR regulator